MTNPNICRNDCKSGMTLVEILIVITIIGVLVALGMSGVTRGIASANRAKCLGNLKQIGAAAEQYTQDNNNTFPPIDFWPNLLSQYLIDPLVARNLPPHTQTVFWCPCAGSGASAPASAYNGNICYAINAQGYAGLGRFKETSSNGRRTDPAKRIAFMDGNSANIWDTSPQRIPAWHGDSYNVVFQDSHAETLNSKECVPGSAAWRNLFWGYARY